MGEFIFAETSEHMTQTQKQVRLQDSLLNLKHYMQHIREH